MQKLNDLSPCLTPLEPDSTLIAVIEMSLSSWLVAGIVPGVERQPLKKLAVESPRQQRCYGAAARIIASIGADVNPMEHPHAEVE